MTYSKNTLTQIRNCMIYLYKEFVPKIICVFEIFVPNIMSEKKIIQSYHDQCPKLNSRSKIWTKCSISYIGMNLYKFFI